MSRVRRFIGNERGEGEGGVLLALCAFSGFIVFIAMIYIATGGTLASFLSGIGWPLW